MAKSIRLLNVDYIVTSSDKTIDLNSLGTAAGNSNGRDPASVGAVMGGYQGNAISIADVSIFSMTAKANATSPASMSRAQYGGIGASNSTLLMMIGGNQHQNGWSSKVRTYNFTSQAVNDAWASVTNYASHSAGVCDPLNDNAYDLGGYQPTNGSTTTAITKVSFTSANTVSVISATITNPVYAAAEGISSESHGYSVGGKASSGGSITNDITKFAYSNESIENGWGTMLVGRKSACSTSDGTTGYIFGGDDGSTDQTDKQKFSLSGSSSQAVSFGTLSVARQGTGCVTNSTSAFIVGNQCYAVDTSLNNTITEFSFSDEAHEETWGTISDGRNRTTSGEGNP